MPIYLVDTAHAGRRKRQRGFRDADIEFAFRFATRVRKNVYLLTKKDATREIEIRRRDIRRLARMHGSGTFPSREQRAAMIKRCRNEIQLLERLCGCEMVIIGREIITVYKSEKKRFSPGVIRRKKRQCREKFRRRPG